MAPTLAARQDTSDPVSYTCTCQAHTEGGSILLFYRYWANSPVLPDAHISHSAAPHALADFHRQLASRLRIGGKFRIATEGFNITLGGTRSAIEEYIEACSTHWSFAGIDISTPTARNQYFKPTPGCACAFNGEASVRVTAEITPLGVTNYSPTSWSKVIALPPAEFHDFLKKGDLPLIDVRNHYESRIGYFVTGDGTVAVRPAVRRFSQWPGYVVKHVLGNDAYSKPQGIATYCTGGIRCEKGARWMQETLSNEGGNDVPVYTLHGGIVAYQAWMEEEIMAGRKKPEDGLFKGRNYVFDARGAIGEQEAVSACHSCGKPEDRLGKCEVFGCHLVLVVCEPCERKGGIICCDDCPKTTLGQERLANPSRRMCKCESDREKMLWGEGGASLGRAKRQQKTQTHSRDKRVT